MFHRPFRILALALLVLAVGFGQWHQMLDGVLGHGHEFAQECHGAEVKAEAAGTHGAVASAPTHSEGSSKTERCGCCAHVLVVALSEAPAGLISEMLVTGRLPLTQTRPSDALPVGIEYPPQLA